VDERYFAERATAGHQPGRGEVTLLDESAYLIAFFSTSTGAGAAGKK